MTNLRSGSTVLTKTETLPTTGGETESTITAMNFGQVFQKDDSTTIACKRVITGVGATEDKTISKTVTFVAEDREETLEP